MKCLQNLKTIISTTSARIVLTSSWRFFPKSRSKLESSFREVGIDSLLGWTGDEGKTRVDEIYHWLKNFDRKTVEEDIIVTRWIAIDDMDLLTLDQERMQGHFVMTDPSQGITEETIQQAISLLT